MRDSSAQRQRSWWAIENAGLAAGERNQLIRGYSHAHKVNGSVINRLRQRAGERMEGTALIVEIERAVMVVSIRVRGSRFHMRVPVGSDWRRLIHVQGVLVDQRDDPRHLRDNEERQ